MTYTIETLDDGWIFFSGGGTGEELEEGLAGLNAILHHRFKRLGIK